MKSNLYSLVRLKITNLKGPSVGLRRNTRTWFDKMPTSTPIGQPVELKVENAIAPNGPSVSAKVVPFDMPRLSEDVE